MPIYDAECPTCGLIEIDVMAGVEEEIVCYKCQSKMKRLISAPRVHVFRAGFYEHIDREPIYIGDARQLRQECNERGLRSNYVENEGHPK